MPPMEDAVASSNRTLAVSFLKLNSSDSVKILFISKLKFSPNISVASGNFIRVLRPFSCSIPSESIFVVETVIPPFLAVFFSRMGS